MCSRLTWEALKRLDNRELSTDNDLFIFCSTYWVCSCFFFIIFFISFYFYFNRICKSLLLLSLSISLWESLVSNYSIMRFNLVFYCIYFFISLFTFFIYLYFYLVINFTDSSALITLEWH